MGQRSSPSTSPLLSPHPEGVGGWESSPPPRVGGRLQGTSGCRLGGWEFSGLPVFPKGGDTQATFAERRVRKRQRQTPGKDVVENHSDRR